MSKELELGILVVVVLKARNLNDKHSFYKQDVFAQATLNGVNKKTPVEIKGGQHPVWDAELRFPVMKQVTEKSRKLEVACFAQERKSDDLLGKGIVDINETLQTGEFDEWVSLSIDGVARGEVYLEMTYFPVSNAGTQLTVSTTGVTKRPSKLAPVERLSHPPQSPLRSSAREVESKKPQGQPNISPIADPRYLGAPSLSPPSPSGASHKRAESPLPSLPQLGPKSAPLPDALLPGGARNKKNGSSLSLQQVLSDPYVPPSPILPPTLRPGIQTGRRIPSDGSNSGSRISSTSLPQAPQIVPYGYPAESGPGSLAPSYSRPPGQLASMNMTTVPPAVSYPPPTSLPPFWAGGEPTRPVTFPIAMTPAPPEVNSSYSILERPVAIRPATNELLDPYLQARYQTPLPLPPGHSDNQSHSRQPSSQQVRVSPDRDRIEAIRLAEEEAARRKEQTNKDLELALQLDRELNVND